MPEPNTRAELLRAAGFDDAAAFLERADQLQQPASADTTPAEQRDTTPGEPLQAITWRDPGEAHRRAEGEFLLAKLRRDTGIGTGDDGWTATAA